jgi:hypothetical protein
MCGRQKRKARKKIRINAEDTENAEVAEKKEAQALRLRSGQAGVPVPLCHKGLA